MKKLLLFSVVAVFAISCNENKSDNAASTATDSSKATGTPIANLDFPYKLEKPYAEWQPGDPMHAVNAMKCLKAWETNNIAESVSYFGDSLDFRADYFQQKLPHDSLTGFFSKQRNLYSNVTIKMGDWESVISKDKKIEYVTMWYKQITTDKNGKTDSIAVVDDCKIVNGKIVELDERVQHYAAKK